MSISGVVYIITIVITNCIFYYIGFDLGQREVCAGFVAEQVRIETQAKESQRRFNEWCLTTKHKCRIK
jgi:hypothetical protein